MSLARIAVRSIAFKAPRVAMPVMALRSLSGSAVSQKDVIQDLYIKELKGYKPAPAAKVEEGQVKELKLPAAPAVPQVDADLAEQLAAYDKEPEEVSA
ncbi:hypothetical protein DFQ28_008654 [Apophysomyces sp. BC1034]|nr:hypothetical protein DFQ30_001419 [Apophysomyces sp. BC1015]KAG0180926.1 hypothetical protein DFQ29_009865 [Apophysomyces sp. BC1021]KAG0185862.1 hypothetical protein DFQ28_008654 [Apophysomyces sp. BC1034]